MRARGLVGRRLVSDVSAGGDDGGGVDINGIRNRGVGIGGNGKC